MANTKEITLKLPIDDVNTILQALGNMPFQQVYRIIQEIQQQASSQLGGEAADLNVPSK